MPSSFGYGRLCEGKERGGIRTCLWNERPDAWQPLNPHSFQGLGAGASAWCMPTTRAPAMRSAPATASRRRCATSSPSSGAAPAESAQGGAAGLVLCPVCGRRSHPHSLAKKPCLQSMVGCTRPISVPSRARVLLTLSTTVTVTVRSPRWKPRAAGLCALKGPSCMPRKRQGMCKAHGEEHPATTGRCRRAASKSCSGKEERAKRTAAMQQFAMQQFVHDSLELSLSCGFEPRSRCGWPARAGRGFQVEGGAQPRRTHANAQARGVADGDVTSRNSTAGYVSQGKAAGHAHGRT